MSATLTYEPFRLPAGILAVAVHGAFFALLYFGFSWQTFPPATMKVELWASLPDEVAAPPAPPKPIVEEIVKPAQPVEAVKPEIALPDKKKAVSKPEKRKIETKPVIQKPAEQKPAEPNPAVRIAEQQAAREQAVKQAESAAAIGRIVDEYKAKIMAKIRSNIVMPPDVVQDARAEFSVTLLPGGSVLPPKLIKSSGNTAYDNAVERAILKSDPLPLPPDVAMFNRFRELNLVFKPTE